MLNNSLHSVDFGYRTPLCFGNGEGLSLVLFRVHSSNSCPFLHHAQPLDEMLPACAMRLYSIR